MEARLLYEELVAAAPAVRQPLLGWAKLEEADCNFSAALQLLDRIDATWPNDPFAMLTRAELLGRIKRYDDALAILDTLAQQEPLGKLRPAELSARGRLLDQIGRYDDAFLAFAEAKRLEREVIGYRYLDQKAELLINSLHRFITRSRLATMQRPKPRDDVAEPIFIIGFPRSGTTLVEQILSAHPQISAGGELPLINNIAQMMPRLLNSPLEYPDALAELWMGDQRDGLENLRDFYLQKINSMGIVNPGASWFTDKMPLNETHLGLIGLMFPRSPVIHVIRHPLDIMVSAMANIFTHGFYCGSALETAATHYMRVMKLVEHYLREVDLKYLAVRYEDLIGDQPTIVRSMLKFIGEQFDERCIRFEENRRYARTASYAQVTEKLHNRSRFRYRNYRRQLEPVVATLAPVIEQLGYNVE